MATFRMRSSATLSTIVGPTLGTLASAVPGAAATDDAPSAVAPDRNTIYFTVILVVAGCLVGVAVQYPAFTPLAGLSVFAAMYVVAQVID